MCGKRVAPSQPQLTSAPNVRFRPIGGHSLLVRLTSIQYHYLCNEWWERGRMAPRFVAKQLSRPSGLGGVVVRFLMNRGNVRLNSFAVSKMALTSNDRVLEIGFGGGLALSDLISGAGFVCGIDPSEDVIAAAQRRFSAAVKKGAAEFKVGSVESLPVPSGAFDKVLSVNTVYFWTSLKSGMTEIRRVLSPGGRVVIGFVPKGRMDRMKMPPDIFAPRTPEDIASTLREAGFADVEICAPWGEDRPMAATGLVSD